MPHHPDSKKPNHKNVLHKGDLVRQFIVQPKKDQKKFEIAALLIALNITTHNCWENAKPNRHRLTPHKPTLEQIQEIHANNVMQLKQKQKSKSPQQAAGYFFLIDFTGAGNPRSSIQRERTHAPLEKPHAQSRGVSCK